MSKKIMCILIILFALAMLSMFVEIGSHKYMISGQGTVFYVNKYTEKDGCIIFDVYKICGNYKVHAL